jgi:hypothetical protein
VFPTRRAATSSASRCPTSGPVLQQLLQVFGCGKNSVAELRGVPPLLDALVEQLFVLDDPRLPCRPPQVQLMIKGVEPAGVPDKGLLKVEVEAAEVAVRTLLEQVDRVGVPGPLQHQLPVTGPAGVPGQLHGW